MTVSKVEDENQNPGFCRQGLSSLEIILFPACNSTKINGPAAGACVPPSSKVSRNLRGKKPRVSK